MDQRPSSSELLDRELPALGLPDFHLLQRRVGQMHELADVLEQAQAALINRDLRGIERLTARQRELCALLREVETKTRSQDYLPEQQSAMACELTAAGKRVRDLNRLHAALLRRARRTVDIFCRVLASCAVTYAPPGHSVSRLIQGK